MKLCKDCKWCERTWFAKAIGSFTYATCESPLAYNRENLVSGEKKKYVDLCVSQRSVDFEDGRICGESGHWFEPKGAK